MPLTVASVVVVWPIISNEVESSGILCDLKSSQQVTNSHDKELFSGSITTPTRVTNLNKTSSWAGAGAYGIPIDRSESIRQENLPSVINSKTS